VNPTHAFLAAALSLAAAPFAQVHERRDPGDRPERAEPGRPRGGSEPFRERGWQEEVRRIVREEVRAALHEALQRLHGEHGDRAHGHGGGEPGAWQRVQPRLRSVEVAPRLRTLHVQGQRPFVTVQRAGAAQDAKVRVEVRAEDGGRKVEVRKVDVRDEKSKKPEGKTQRRALVLGADEPRVLRLGSAGGNDPVVLELQAIDDIESDREDGEECECEPEQQPAEAKQQPREAKPAPLMFRTPTRAARPRIWV
jgi:hypothetical protein